MFNVSALELGKSGDSVRDQLLARTWAPAAGHISGGLWTHTGLPGREGGPTQGLYILVAKAPKT